MLFMTAFILSLTSPPAIGISFAALNLRPFKVRLSAPACSTDCIESIPVNKVKLSPVIQRQMLFSVFDKLERFVFLHMVFTAVTEIIALVKGNVRAVAIVCSSEITVAVPVVINAADKLFPDAE